MTKRAPRSFANADKLSDLPGLGSDQAAPLLSWAIKEADQLTALERKKQEVDQRLAELAAKLAATDELKRLEKCREALAAAKKKALDVPAVHLAKDALNEAKANFEALPQAVEAKRTVLEGKEIDEASRQRRRELVDRLFRRRAPITIDHVQGPALPLGDPATPAATSLDLTAGVPLPDLKPGDTVTIRLAVDPKHLSPDVTIPPALGAGLDLSGPPSKEALEYVAQAVKPVVDAIAKATSKQPDPELAAAEKQLGLAAGALHRPSNAPPARKPSAIAAAHAPVAPPPPPPPAKPSVLRCSGCGGTRARPKLREDGGGMCLLAFHLLPEKVPAPAHPEGSCPECYVVKGSPHWPDCAAVKAKRAAAAPSDDDLPL